MTEQEDEARAINCGGTKADCSDAKPRLSFFPCGAENCSRP